MVPFSALWERLRISLKAGGGGGRSQSGAAGGRYKETPSYYRGPQYPTILLLQPQERVSHWCTDPSAPCRQLGSWTLSLPLRAEFSPLEGPPSRGSNSTRGSCAKVQSLWKPALGPQRLLVIACSCPGSSALCYITGIFLRWSEHPKAN